MRLHDTIVAVSTPMGRGGLGVVRLSGPESKAVAAHVLRFAKPPDWRPWCSTLATLPDAEGHQVDEVVVSYFERPRSYTAEDVVEISCHGAPVILRFAVEQACRHGARLAEPGEFTLRAFLNGRLDLPQAEAVRDLIEATTLYQARVAAQQAGGALSRRIAPFKEMLLELVSLLEAGIDFAEDDVTVAADAEILARLEPLASGLRALAGSFAYGKLVHDGLTLAIAGRPNVGKSSLFNRLLEQDRAIVTEVPGTTRDLVSEVASLGGIPVKFIDTAGIRATADRVESLGVNRAYEAMADADLTLLVVDLSSPLEEEDEELIRRTAAQARCLVVGNKIDLPQRAELRPGWVAVSALTGDGLDILRSRILETVAPEGQVEQDAGFLTSIRHEQLIREAVSFLDQARDTVAGRVPHEMLLVDLYSALQSIDALTGATTADDILNRIFSTFCIGK